MKKRFLIPAIIVSLTGSMLCSSCLGSFSLTKKLLAWNNQVGDKLVNELVFFALWPLPAYPVSLLADVLVLNSIEFWSGNKPVASSERVVEGIDGRYLVKSDADGYTIITEETGETVRLDFCADTHTWSYSTNGSESVPFMTFIDDSHVRVPSQSGWQTVELTRTGIKDFAAL